VSNGILKMDGKWGPLIDSCLIYWTPPTAPFLNLLPAVILELGVIIMDGKMAHKKRNNSLSHTVSLPLHTLLDGKTPCYGKGLHSGRQPLAERK